MSTLSRSFPRQVTSSPNSPYRSCHSYWVQGTVRCQLTISLARYYIFLVHTHKLAPVEPKYVPAGHGAQTPEEDPPADSEGILAWISPSFKPPSLCLFLFLALSNSSLPRSLSTFHFVFMCICILFERKTSPSGTYNCRQWSSYIFQHMVHSIYLVAIYDARHTELDRR